MNKVEGERFERLLGALTQQNTVVAQLAESISFLTQEQSESNRLLTGFLSKFNPSTFNSGDHSPASVDSDDT